MNVMRVDRPGMLSVLQDSGRYGFQRFGVPVNGAMDEWSCRLANALVGNADDAAALEINVAGPAIRFAQDTLISVTGADIAVTVAGMPLPMHCAVMVRHDVPVVFAHCRRGARAYLAVRGGFAPETALGSRSTNLRARFGGMEGRALRAGDRVAVASLHREMLPLARMMVQSAMPFVAAARPDGAVAPPTCDALRFLPGPQWERFTPAARSTFEQQGFSVSSQSDRMGFRLEGPSLALSAPLEIVSEAVTFGTVQVPPGGSPIVLMADRQSVGGYPKIAYIISADLPSLAQVMPGAELRFRAVTAETAQRELLAMEDRHAAVAVESARLLGLPHR
ncbi:biotin-dependent carboxyltransferase family protein [Cupriavidus pauculus]|uniref:Biotin-dependent carboxyltransferase n=1 Tax=Cupriavidus pauculus TaxID=82633 RepID=A0A3G8H9U3_9BURK|nr:biotin-dependent carboxyltransferase family protein [Cupriavidus pauculus]AZG17243.1 biotin-dependent carboxyltransferase [Cupriavidus pauculus]